MTMFPGRRSPSADLIYDTPCLQSGHMQQSIIPHIVTVRRQYTYVQLSVLTNETTSNTTPDKVLVQQTSVMQIITILHLPNSEHRLTLSQDGHSRLQKLDGMHIIQILQRVCMLLIIPHEGNPSQYRRFRVTPRGTESTCCCFGKCLSLVQLFSVTPRCLLHPIFSGAVSSWTQSAARHAAGCPTPTLRSGGHTDTAPLKRRGFRAWAAADGGRGCVGAASLTALECGLKR